MTSAKVKLRKPARADGTCQVQMQVIIERKVWVDNLKINWPPELFDEELGQCLASLPPAERGPDYKAMLEGLTAAAGGTVQLLARRVRDHNLAIGKALAKANEVFVVWRLSDQTLTLERFKQEYSTSGSKDDFCAYYKAKVQERFRKEKISVTTRKNHLSTYNALVKFRPFIPFSTLTTDFADEFDAYLKKHVPGANTRWGRHKDVKTYLSLARKDRKKFEDPYADFKNKEVKGQWKPLRTAELEKLEAYYKMCAPRTNHRRVLARFLFNCCSSLRLGDLKNIENATIENQEMTWKMHKTYAKTLQESMLPLTYRALGYLKDAQEEEGLPGFYNYADPTSNRLLVAIGQRLGIESRMHHHVGRETFATEFIRRGGKVEVLQKLMGHSKITTTMKYVHVDADMKRAAIEQLNAQDIGAELAKLAMA
ncbi:site-specific integrase [Hymenobacter negativus]|uniref:Site-specific integrase n=1 Tax=Hymenobacter negativus TaxID=2795026 RepID=A0ABS3Q9I5_9BACT|nr:site-specific integrase [Hymenobacter negativus]MBO2007877.1 site-specific integrase [Hymenobacter negativus]